MTNYEKLIQYALRIIAKKRYTSFEMAKKLKQFMAKAGSTIEIDENSPKDDSTGDHIKAVLERLHELKYLDDSGYAEDYISDRKKFKPRGKFLLTRELKNKGLDSNLIQNALEKQPIDEFETAIKALDKKSRQWQTLPVQKQRERAFRFLSARGFDQDAIYKALKHCYNPHVK